MSALPRAYGKAVHEQSGWWGTFPLDYPVEVGDVVQLDEDGRMIGVRSIFDTPGFSMPIVVTPVEGAAGWSRHAAKSRLAAASAGASTAVGAGATAAVKVSFSEAGGFVLEDVSGEYRRLQDVDVARKWVLGLAKNGDWNNAYVLVTEIVAASPATVLVSSASESSIVLNGTGLPADLTGVNLADPQFGFAEASFDEGIYKSVSKRSHPLYHCVRIRRRWWGANNAELQGGSAVSADDAFSAIRRRRCVTSPPAR